MLKAAFRYKPLLYATIMVCAMWMGFLLQKLGFFENCSGALIPLNPSGLKGIFFSPFLHGGLDHIVGNSIPIFVLIFLLFQFYAPIAKKVFFTGWFSAAFLVWLLPPLDIFTGETNHVCIIGASGIVYVLAFYLFFSGIFRWNLKLMAISMVVAFYYGSLIWGVVPEELFSSLPEPSRISWQSHLSGAVVGIILAYIYRNSGDKNVRFIWELPNYYSEKDDKLWQNYKMESPEDFLELPYRKKEDHWDHLDEIRKRE